MQTLDVSEFSEYISYKLGELSRQSMCLSINSEEKVAKANMMRGAYLELTRLLDDLESGNYKARLAAYRKE